MTDVTATTNAPATLVARSVDIDGEGNFTKGCSFSPDGLCVLTSTAWDNVLRLYNTPYAATTTAPPSPLPKRDPSSNGGDDASERGDGPSPPTTPPTPIVEPWRTALSARCGDAVRSYDWYPRMDSSDPSTCAFVAACRDQPIHLIDAYTSRIRATYSPHNGLDEMESPSVVAFSPDGERIFASGFKSERTVHVFRTSFPGSRNADVWRLGKTRRSKDGQKGIVSAIAFPPLGDGGCRNVFALGTYSPGSIYLYDDRASHGLDDPVGAILTGGLCVVGHGRSFARKKRRFAEVSAPEDAGPSVEGEGGGGVGGGADDIFSQAKANWYRSRTRTGVSQLRFSPGDGRVLYGASRRSDAVLAWDVRALSSDPDAASHPIAGMRAYPRDASDTNQRLEFDLDGSGSRLFASGRDGTVRIYDAKRGERLGTIGGLDDAANGVSYAPSADGKGLLAVATGARRFAENYDDEEGARPSDADGRNAVPPGSLELYKL